MSVLRSCPKPERSTSQREWREKARDICGKIVRLRGICDRCGRTENKYQMHAAHVIPARYGNTDCNTDNRVCLCAFCHTADNDSAHLNERDFHEWYDSKYPGKRDSLWKQARAVCRLDFVGVYSDLLERLYEMLKAKRDAEK